MLEIFTFILAIATVYLAYQTHRLATLTSLFEETRLSIDQNWRLWEHRAAVHVPVAPENLGEEQWRWRLPILNHLNILLLAYRRETFGLGRFTADKRLESHIAKSKDAIRTFRTDTNGRNELDRLLQPGEGFPTDFVKWVRAKCIVD